MANFGWVNEFPRDATRALRGLVRSPTFTITAIVTLALGLGAGTAIFTLADQLLYRPLAVPEPGRLIGIAAIDAEGRPLGLLPPMVDAMHEEEVVQGVCGFVGPSLIVEIHQRTSPLETHLLTGGCFETLGVRPILGRLLTVGDALAGAPHVVVLAYDTWVREYDRRASVIGDTLNLDGTPYTIVGVTEPAFRGLRLAIPASLFIPLANFESGLAAAFPPREFLPTTVYARLPPGVTAEEAAARLGVQWPRWLEASAPRQMNAVQRDRYTHRQVRVSDASMGLDRSLREQFRAPLTALLAISGLVLLVSCLNVANLLLARAVGRSRETTVQVALGASRARLLRAVVIESALLLVGGLIAGLLVASWVDVVLIAMFKEALPDFALEVVPDGRVLVFAIASAALAFLLFAAVPAWRASRIDLAALNAASMRMSGGHGRLRRVAVVAQVAFTVVLVVTGALFVETLRQLRSAPLGLSVDDVLGAQLSAQPGGYQRGFAASAYYDLLLRRVQGVAGVDQAALSFNAVLKGGFSSVAVAAVGSDQEVTVEQSFVTDNFFTTMQIPLLQGTSFRQREASSGGRTAIVSAATARALFGDTSAVGRTLRVGANPATQAVQIVGVASDAVLSTPQVRNTRVVYLSFWEGGPNVQIYPTLLVRSTDVRHVTAAALNDVVASGGREYVSQIRTLVEQRDATLVQERLLAVVSASYSALGLAVAAVGLYGLLIVSVSQRTRELGVRMAVGAGRRQILWLVLKGAWTLIGIGLLIGVPSAWAASRVTISMVAGTAPGAVWAIVFAVSTIVIVGTAAAWIPARRALRVNPTVALRTE